VPPPPPATSVTVLPSAITASTADTAAQPRTHIPHAKGVSTISRSSRQASAETLSGISRRPEVKRLPEQYTERVRRQGLEP
jgi:hypothetical protein